MYNVFTVVSHTIHPSIHHITSIHPSAIDPHMHAYHNPTNNHSLNEYPLTHSLTHVALIRYTNIPVLVVNSANSFFTANSACASSVSATQTYSSSSYQSNLATSASVSGVYAGKLISKLQQ